MIIMGNYRSGMSLTNGSIAYLRHIYLGKSLDILIASADFGLVDDLHGAKVSP